MQPAEKMDRSHDVDETVDAAPGMRWSSTRTRLCHQNLISNLAFAWMHEYHQSKSHSCHISIYDTDDGSASLTFPVCSLELGPLMQSTVSLPAFTLNDISLLSDSNEEGLLRCLGTLRSQPDENIHDESRKRLRSLQCFLRGGPLLCPAFGERLGILRSCFGNFQRQSLSLSHIWGTAKSDRGGAPFRLAPFPFSPESPARPSRNRLLYHMEHSRTDPTFSLDHSSDYGPHRIKAQTSTPPLVEEDGNRHGTFLSGIFTRDVVLSQVQPPSTSVFEDLSFHICGLSYSDVSDPPPRISPSTTRSDSIAGGDCDTGEHGESPTVDTSLCDLPSIPDELASLLEDVFIGMHSSISMEAPLPSSVVSVTFGVPRGCGSVLPVDSTDDDEDMFYDSPPQPLPSTCSLILSPPAPRAGFDPVYHDFTVNLDDCDDSEGSPPQPLPSTCSLINLSAPTYVTSTPHVRNEPGRFPSRGIFLEQSKAGHSLHNIHTSRHIQRELKDDYLQRDFESNLDLIHPLSFKPALELDSLDRHAMVQVEDLRTVEDSRQHTISPRSFEENITLALLDAMHSRSTATDCTFTRHTASPVPTAQKKAKATSKLGRKAKTLATSAKTLTKRAFRGVFRFVS